ncbi:fungal cellulose binding domain-containing protein [Verticillium alfalfae VaMs.102]|uniref:lytic cellulose monooxygenase (C4-dehydrogenating) n=1 Tax=Verticillium alfalfae (strain VaMs.102 / ATCC MYA-4576 / FGSC 10136) TaxID=526221 RepID=C9SUD7_VERA1|nr:fungal cellulose binding domain-containing protein [Verticillium alfalfae VaMs.102]EEY22448.1 fungal cellulose binding domain-containing protein [Verticillium alfalfae VaMs.102]
MRFSILAVAALTPLASAHYFFDKLIIDGVETRSNEFVRSNTRPAKYNPTKWENVRDDMTPDVNDFRCNKGAFTFAGQTGTAEVKAGSKLAVKLAVGATMQHPGPALVYMSKAPATAKAYEGNGEWFKIFEESDTPDGEYLIRPEHIGVHGAHVGQAEFYYTCVQVKVTGGGNGTPGPTVKFPGAYKKDDPSFNFSIYGGVKDYPMPGPAVWTGGHSVGSADPAPGESGPVPSATSTVAATPVESEPVFAAPSDVATTEAASPTAAPGSGSGSGGDYEEVCTRTRRRRQRGRKARRAFRESLRKL